jgi:plasmid stabilization system protein ParE
MDNPEQVIRMLRSVLKDIAEYAEMPTDTVQRRELEKRLRIIAQDTRYVLEKLTEKNHD